MNVEGAKDGDSLKLNGILEDLFAVLINSRKMGIKAVGTLELTVEELAEEALTIALEGGEQAEIRTEHRTAAALTVQKKDTCRIKDEIILPANKPNIRELIWQDVTLRGMELRPGEDEILIKGELGVFVLYESGETEQKTGWLEQSVPFNSHIDVHGSREGIAASLGAVLAGAELEVKPDYDGELRVLHVDAVLNLDIRMYEEEGVDLVADVYSLKKELIPEKAETDYERLLINSASRCRVSGRMTTEQTDMQILQICHSSGEVKLDDCTAVEQGLRVEGAVQVEVLYITSDDSHPILCRKEAIPFEQLIEVPGHDKGQRLVSGCYPRPACGGYGQRDGDGCEGCGTAADPGAGKGAGGACGVRDRGAAGSDGSESAACFCALRGTARRYAMGDREKLSQHGRAHL